MIKVYNSKYNRPKNFIEQHVREVSAGKWGMQSTGNVALREAAEAGGHRRGRM
jgi:hypothetical protein